MSKKYYAKNKEKCKAYQKAYSGKNKEKQKEWAENYRARKRDEINSKHRTYCRKNREKFKLYRKEYRQTENAKLSAKKSIAKRNRNMGFNILMNNPFPKEIKIVWHHINNIFVIPVPEQTHRKFVFGVDGVPKHRKKIFNFLKKINLINGFEVIEL